MSLLQNLNFYALGPNWFVLILIWSLAWKGVALWKCGRNNQLHWFIAILILNTVGILPIIYLAWFQQKKKKITK